MGKVRKGEGVKETPESLKEELLKLFRDLKEALIREGHK